MRDMNNSLSRWLLLAALIAALGLGGCGDDDDNLIGPQTNLIKFEEGGTASLDNRVFVTVPPEAITEDAYVEITAVEEFPSLPSDRGLASQVFTISLSNGQIQDTIWIDVTYLNELMPSDVLEGTLLVGYVADGSWTFMTPALQTDANRARIPAVSEITVAVIWAEQDARSTISSIIGDAVSLMQGQRGTNFSDLLPQGTVETIITQFQDIKTALDNATADDGAVTNAVETFFGVLRAIEDGDGIIHYSHAADLIAAYQTLGTALGVFDAVETTDPPRAPFGTVNFLPQAFAGLLAEPATFQRSWMRRTAGKTQTTATLIEHFFAQLNYKPVFGGLTYLDYPEGYERDTLTVREDEHGVYWLDMYEMQDPSGETYYFDYFRDRQLSLYWPVESEVLLFNFPQGYNPPNGLGIVVSFENDIIDVESFSADALSNAQADEHGVWFYYGVGVAAMEGLRKQDGEITIRFGGSTGAQMDHEMFPVSRRPVLSYGDWTEPSPVTDLANVEYRGNSIRLQWTAPGNDLSSGTATWYDFRYNTVPITEENWNSSVKLMGEIAPASSGTLEEWTVLPYDLSEPTYMAMRTLDQDYNRSEISNTIAIKGIDQIEVIFEESALEFAIRNLTGNVSDPLMASELVNFTDLILMGRAIRDLSGLEFLPNLTSLNLSQSQLIFDIDPLKHLLSLQRLELQVNYIHDISPLWLMTDMRYLDLTSNRVQDITPLQDMEHLDSLNLSFNGVSNQLPLRKLRNLVYLNLAGNELLELSGMQHLTELRTLDLSGNPVYSFHELIDNPGFGEGDTLIVRDRALTRELLRVVFPALEAKGVTVLHD